LISGRNPELLIGQQVIAAPILKRSRLEVLPTGYLLIDADNRTTVSYMSNTVPIPADKYSVAVCTAMAGEMLGLKLIYMDAGSGAKYPISPRMIASVRKSIDVPLIIGGGINSVDKALNSLKAGADMLVVGNGIEENPSLLIEVSDAVNHLNQELDIH
jgi:putative glycerol-1-phosphate prenyltransferase